MNSKINIEKATLENKNYRKVITTTKQMQLVLMSLEKGEDIPKEKHNDITQFIRVESGKGTVSIGRKTYRMGDGDSIIIPAGKWHYIKNMGNKPFKLYTIYTPPEHPKNTVQKRKPECKNNH